MTCRQCGTPSPVAGGGCGAMMAAGMAQMAAAAGMTAGMNGIAGGPRSGGMKAGDWYCASCGDLQFARNNACRKCGSPKTGMEMNVPGAPGDWICPSCRDLQFARNSECRRCGEPKPENPEPATNPALAAMAGMAGMGLPFAACGKGKGKGAMPGDWICPSCQDLQFARNTHCRQCGTEKPEGAEAIGAGMGGMMLPGGKGMCGKGLKPGDWHCESCGDLQFARNTECRRCGAPNPSSSGGKVYGERPGDWRCPSCGDFQFARNRKCKVCGTDNPDGGAAAEAAEAAAAQAASEMEKREGDWECPTCGDYQFARNPVCRKCQTPNPDENAAAAAGAKPQEIRNGDWICGVCNDLQFARNDTCRRCGAQGPRLAQMAAANPMLAAAAAAGMNPMAACAAMASQMQMSSRMMGAPRMSAPRMTGPGGGGKPTWVCPQCNVLCSANDNFCGSVESSEQEQL
eukprot:CAMPEP_0178425040 /NCGR_PEP_ID=MMETSP0689_2-20121128/28519_1 /TAXON_ID=160604 /ORGANISM="Amphidinium massartii, Strain CS-259" /LENGTH=457 /DNA_ID=CAMNT_0020046693 /DNA_START=92 /DNA_END=1466 /DNA_ORIENTATION=+